MNYKCIIFDCDGVLVDSEEISNNVLIDMANGVGVTIEKAYALENFAGKSLKSSFEHIEQLIQKKLPEHFEKEYRERTFQAFKTELQPIEGIHEVLNALTVPYCVASSGPLEKIRLNLTTTHLIEHFEGKMYSSYEIGSWKPNPEIFVHAAKQMGFAPHECVVVEDSLAGVIAARRGGFDVFGFANEGNQEAFEAEGAEVFFEMGELFAKFKH